MTFLHERLFLLYNADGTGTVQGVFDIDVNKHSANLQYIECECRSILRPRSTVKSPYRSIGLVGGRISDSVMVWTISFDYEF